MGLIRTGAKTAYIGFLKQLHKKRLHITQSVIYYPIDWKFGLHVKDFNRMASLQLAAEDIKRRSIPGQVAEVGVYQGSFAAHINAMFPDRKLYLFDTFEGFDSRDIADEEKRNLSDGGQDFSQTSVELVLSNMPHRELCVPCKGYFPETAAHLDERFAFVSLDTDLFAPIYAGLQYFYPRLNHGGVIFVHDFNNSLYPGAKEAVIAFCDENQIGYAQIPDGGGTAVVSR